MFSVKHIKLFLNSSVYFCSEIFKNLLLSLI